ncbi:aldose 1-epimerase [Geomicrobium halophilum]|uniref:Aldose 1-epimerase n=1 Tax=Geomicrobium halophilum TaxID=549000 RepID=A0A841PWP9_9BACL|nr:aldose epimerase family protein [Geomicrobium halophilum]MBB6450931.1 aldose 1-epimerase [Geomicrobium halophilum]
MFKEQRIQVYKGHDLMQLEMINEIGARLCVLNYGGRITGWYPSNQPDHSLVLAYENPMDYLTDTNYLGAIVGRVAGRVPHGEMKILDHKWPLSQNEGHHHLHGGDQGFSDVFWDYHYEETDSDLWLHLFYASTHGEQGYPGKVNLKVTYVLKKDQDEIRMKVEAVSDQDTWLSIANHSYFNLTTEVDATILGHQIQAPVESVLALDDELIPTGELIEPENTAFDIREKTSIRKIVDAQHPQIETAHGGIDHFFIWQENKAQAPIRLFDPLSRQSLHITTTEPGAVIYTAQKLETDQPLKGGNGTPFRGVCIETQRLPQVFSGLERPTCFISADETYHSETVYTVSSME